MSILCILLGVYLDFLILIQNGQSNVTVNDIFSQAWKGCQKPMWFRILNIDRITNSIEVECHSFDGLNVFPEVWSLDSTEAGFEIGDYKLVK